MGLRSWMRRKEEEVGERYREHEERARELREIKKEQAREERARKHELKKEYLKEYAEARHEAMRKEMRERARHKARAAVRPAREKLRGYVKGGAGLHTLGGIGERASRAQAAIFGGPAPSKPVNIFGPSAPVRKGKPYTGNPFESAVLTPPKPKRGVQYDVFGRPIAKKKKRKGKTITIKMG